jgi:hypothetical protein
VKTNSAKNIVRALVRALNTLANADTEAAHYDSLFDAGEWSAAAHGPGTNDEQVVAILRPLGISREQARAALSLWARLDRTPAKPWGREEPLASQLRIWLATSEEMNQI